MATTTAVSIPKNALPDADTMAKMKKIAKSIDKNTDAIQQLCTSTVQLYYDLGEMIMIWGKEYEGKITAALLEQAFGIEIRKINTALKIYKHFTDHPEILASMTLTDAIRIIDYRDGKEKKEREKITYAGADSLQPEFSWDDYFEHPPVSRVPLDRYRLLVPEKEENTLYLLQKGLNHPIKFMEIFTGLPKSDTLMLAHKEMLKKMQAAAEAFYSAYEQEEKV